MDSLLGRAGELGDGLGALGDGVLGELSREDETDGRLDLSRRDGRLLVVRCELGSLGGWSSKTVSVRDRGQRGMRENERTNPLKDVVDKGVENQHGLVGDTSVGVDLLEDLVDVGGAARQGRRVSTSRSRSQQRTRTH